MKLILELIFENIETLWELGEYCPYIEDRPPTEIYCHSDGTRGTYTIGTVRLEDNGVSEELIYTPEAWFGLRRFGARKIQYVEVDNLGGMLDQQSWTYLQYLRYRRTRNHWGLFRINPKFMRLLWKRKKILKKKKNL